MTYLIEKPTESTSVKQRSTTCANCPHFNDYRENRGRGWCLLFNRVSFKKHPFTRDCELERVASEDIIRPSYNESDRVSIIDPDTDYTQWTTYIVVAKKRCDPAQSMTRKGTRTKTFNPYRYKTVETALNQTDWYYQLATVEGLKVIPQWIAENDICHYEESHLINPDGEF